MTESPSNSQQNTQNGTSSNPSSSGVLDIPIDIVTEEEMALIEAAMTATRSSAMAVPAISSPSRYSLLQINARSIRSITAMSKRRLSLPSLSSSSPDVEDLGDLRITQKKNRVSESLLYRFRKTRGLSVSDITGAEWCEKQMELSLRFGKKTSDAMKAGTARHVKLEEEVIKKVKVSVESIEDAWALKFLNFITGANQLLVEGLTRELSLIGFAEGVWMVGKVDEIRMPEGDANGNPIFVDTKTRVQKTLPAEPQRRNGRLQLMCYKYLWDTLVADGFPSKKFFDFFSLNPHYILSEQIRENTAKAGIPAKTLDDVIRYFRNTCSILLPADNQMILRYEFQKDNSVLGEEQFAHDPDWLKSQIQGCLEFWLSKREASYTPEEERWKCQYCQFASACPLKTTSDTSHATEISDCNDPCKEATFICRRASLWSVQ